MMRSKVISILFMFGFVFSLGIPATSAGSESSMVQQVPTAALDEPACITNLVGKFNSLKHHGEALGFHLGDSPDPTLGKHYQGIQRLPRGGTPYVVLSRSGNRNIGDPISFNEPGNLVVVRFDSRDPDGERLRSNRLEKGSETAGTVPPAGDRAVHTIYFDGNGWPDYRHAGGMQTFGDFLFVPLDNEGPSATTPGMIALVDMVDPENPTLINEFPMPHTAGAVAIARHPSSNRLLMIVEGPDANDTLKVYLSNGFELDDDRLDFNLIDEWHGSELSGGSWPTGAGAHQTINMIEDCRDGLYLLGSRNDPGLPEGGDDYGTVYKVEIGADNQLHLSQVSNGHFYCVSAAGRICNFVAAAGFYTSPSGELILYATEHENEGPPNLPSFATVRMGEFRHRDTYSPGSPAWAPLPIADPSNGYFIPEGGSVTLNGSLSAPAIAQPWVELYDDNGFLDRSIVIDYADRFEDDWHNFNLLDDALWDLEDGFNDKTSAARWAAPIGCDIVLYEDDNYGGSTFTLAGTGEVEEISNFDNYSWGDTASSMQFTGDGCDDRMTHRWDLDGDLVFETAGETAPFSAATIDGPAEINVRLQVCGPFYGFCPQDVATIHVSNQPPSISAALDATAINEGEQVTVSGAISDPGAADSFTVNVNWGDGESTAVDLPAGSTGYSVAHTYADDGPPNTPSDTLPILVTVTDDDGGSDSADLGVTVNNLPPEIGAIDIPVEPVAVGDEIAASVNFSDPGLLDTHSAEWSWGDGATSPGTVNESPGSGTAAGNHVYTSPGIYAVSVTLRDKDSDTATELHEYVVVYDPDGGFVTGAGKITSPAGAYKPAPTLTGMARFGFVSKYVKGKTTPDGSAQFRFQAADLRFESTSYDWLVVAGARAQFKGLGTLDGAGAYGFMLTAVDGEINGGGGNDKFRIKIWELTADGNEGPVVYDNQVGGDTSDLAEPSTVISSGSIVIHQ